MTDFYGYEAIAMGTALEDSIQQLNLLGKAMPFSYLEEPEPLDILNGEVETVLINNMDQETRFIHVLDKFSNSVNAIPNEEDDKRIHKENICKNLDIENFVNHTASTGPFYLEKMKKVQEERMFLQRILTSTAGQLLTDGSFKPLVEAVLNEQSDDKMYNEMIICEEENRFRIHDFREEVDEIIAEERKDIDDRVKMITHLKDQLQETKAKNIMQLKFGRCQRDGTVDQCSKKCQADEKIIQDEIARYTELIMNEQRVDNEMVTWVRDYTRELQGKTEHWKLKYADDTEALKRNTTVLSLTKARELQRLHEMTKTYKEYYEVVMEYREEKELLEIEKEKEAARERAMLRIQCWWRAICVRSSLGPYAKKKRRRRKKPDKWSPKGKKKK